MVFDPWYYLPVLARKPGALRNGAQFKDWVLPAALDRVQRKLSGSADGYRQMVEILSAPCSAMGCRRSRRPAPRRYARASTRSTSSV